METFKQYMSKWLMIPINTFKKYTEEDKSYAWQTDYTNKVIQIVMPKKLMVPIKTFKNVMPKEVMIPIETFNKKNHMPNKLMKSHSNIYAKRHLKMYT